MRVLSIISPRRLWLLIGLIVAACAPAIPVYAQAPLSALDSARVELVRLRGFIRGAETQASKVLTLLDSARARSQGPAPVVVPPVAVPPIATAPDTLATVTAVQTDPLGDFTLAVGDTMVLRIVSATVGKGTSARAATEAELQSTDFKWGTSGYVSIRPAPDGRSTLVYNARAGQRGRIDIKRGNSLLGQRWVQGSITADTTPSPPSVAVVGTRYVGMSPSSTACARPLIAGEQMGVRGDTALFVRALEGLPAWVYCVADSLAVTLEGDLVVDGESSTEPPTLLTYAPGAVLPTEWPATGQGDTTVTIDSLRIVGQGEGGGLGTGTVLGLLGAGAVASLLLGANATARRGRDDSGEDV